MKKDRTVLIAIAAALCVILGWVLLWRSAQPKAKICVQKTQRGKFQLLVEGAPYLVKGVVYNPIPIGENHQYNFWADRNSPWMEDGRLMLQMGVNTVRFFQPGQDAGQTKKVISQLYEHYGIRSIIGHWMDYWRPGNYADDKYARDLTARVIEMVNTYKDEEGILLWILGNENNMSWHSRGRVRWTCPELQIIKDPQEKEKTQARIYYSLLNKIARRIKEVDPDHPVALGNADSYSLEVAGEVCPDIDLVAVTAYRGKNFGNLWRDIKAKIKKPVLIMEFGCDSFNAQSLEEDQQVQSVFLKSQWQDIQGNAAGAGGEGNALGGCVFEWNDEWWKHDESMPASWLVHNTEGAWSCGGYYFDIAAPGNMNINEEWWGIVALEPQLERGINQRIPREAFYELQKIWRQEK